MRLSDLLVSRDAGSVPQGAPSLQQLRPQGGCMGLWMLGLVVGWWLPWLALPTALRSVCSAVVRSVSSADFQPVARGSDSHRRCSLCGYPVAQKERGLATQVCHHVNRRQLSCLFLNPLVWLHRRGARTCPRAAQLLPKHRVPFRWQCAQPQRGN